MKARHIAGAALDARMVFKNLKIDPRQDFHALDNFQVCGLVEEAARRRYRKPKHANGSTARYFHAYLLRRIRAGEKERS